MNGRIYDPVLARVSGNENDIITQKGKRVVMVTRTQFDIYTSPFVSDKTFNIAYNHELIHVYHHPKYRSSMSREEFQKYTEWVAYGYTMFFYPGAVSPYGVYTGSLPFDIPGHLIPIQFPTIPVPTHGMY